MAKLVKMDKNGQNNHYGLTLYGQKYGQYGFPCDEWDKGISPVKTELKNMHRIKSYGQNKTVC